MDSILFVENLHVAVCDSFDLGSLLVLLLVILFSKPKKTHRGIVLGYWSDATHVTEQKIHRTVGLQIRHPNCSQPLALITMGVTSPSKSTRLESEI